MNFILHDYITESKNKKINFWLPWWAAKLRPEEPWWRLKLTSGLTGSKTINQRNDKLKLVENPHKFYLHYLVFILSCALKINWITKRTTRFSPEISGDMNSTSAESNDSNNNLIYNNDNLSHLCRPRGIKHFNIQRNIISQFYLIIYSLL